MKVKSILGYLGIAFTLIACSAADKNKDFESDSSGAGGASSAVTGDVGVGVTSTGVGGNLTTSTGSGSGGGCAAAAELVYVLSIENDLYSFQPDKKQFTKIGPLQCQTSMTPNSMAVDRDAVAWVNYVADDGMGNDTGGGIFKVSTADGSCQPTNTQLKPHWYRLGMGFAADQAGGTAETLYVAGDPSMFGGNDSPGLGKIDTMSYLLQPVGQYTGALTGQSAELTGTGDARLFGFFVTTPPHLAEINKSTGALLSDKPLNGLETPFDWAFSFWGGSFYFYTMPDETLYPNRTTNVTKYDPTTGMMDTSYMTNIGFRIVGAGVSTCAPIKPPA